MKIYHSSTKIVKNPEIRVEKFNKDFYFDFYCTLFKEQATRWTTRFGKEFLNIYEYDENNDLNIKIFKQRSDDWFDFVINCRNGVPHNYDIVEGPMADDQIYNYIQQYLDKKISREAFWELAKFQYPTHQISFHTEKALETLSFKEAFRVE